MLCLWQPSGHSYDFSRLLMSASCLQVMHGWKDEAEAVMQFLQRSEQIHGEHTVANPVAVSDLVAYVTDLILSTETTKSCVDT